jgi:hypothetical protein
LQQQQKLEKISNLKQMWEEYQNQDDSGRRLKKGKLIYYLNYVSNNYLKLKRMEKKQWRKVKKMDTTTTVVQKDKEKAPKAVAAEAKTDAVAETTMDTA